MEINSIYNENCISTLERMENNRGIREPQARERGTQGEAGECAGHGLHRERGRGYGEPQADACVMAGEG